MALGGGIIPSCYICGAWPFSQPYCVCLIIERWSNARKAGCDMETYFAFTDNDLQYEYVCKCWREQENAPDPPETAEPVETF